MPVETLIRRPRDASSTAYTSVPAPTIGSAIHDAVGVWIDEIPVTPECLLRALEKVDG